jgi:hypothetical protein
LALRHLCSAEPANHTPNSPIVPPTQDSHSQPTSVGLRATGY